MTLIKCVSMHRKILNMFREVEDLIQNVGKVNQRFVTKLECINSSKSILYWKTQPYHQVISKTFLKQ